ncbi:MAG: ornithine carbamoyltransferase [Planctomycetaceae bacterium]|nr:ornithine carbamoyltransferase [Planctomycetaceae bacterium]
MRHFDSLFRLSAQDCLDILRLTANVKAQWKQGQRPRLLDGRMLTLVFEKPSLRTRVSFEAAITHLGGSSLFLTCAEAGLNGREAVADVARVLGSYSDWIVTRTFSHGLVDDFVRHAGCHVINGLSDETHPCQALSDLFTVEETLGSLSGKTLAYIGDGNNVARSLAIASALLGVNFVIAAPKGYELKPDYVASVKKHVPAAGLTQTDDPAAAVAHADIVYTDVWASMGQEAEQEKRKPIFTPYQVNAALMKRAPATARFMHCLPARRNMEVTDDVLDGPQSIAIPQAENRMHVAKGIMLWLAGKH